MPKKYDIEFTPDESLEIFCRIVSKIEKIPIDKCRIAQFITRRLVKYSKQQQYRIIAWKIFAKYVSEENFKSEKYIINEAIIYRLVTSIKKKKSFCLYEIEYKKIEELTGRIKFNNKLKSTVQPKLIEKLKNKQSLKNDVFEEVHGKYDIKLVSLLNASLNPFELTTTLQKKVVEGLLELKKDRAGLMLLINNSKGVEPTFFYGPYEIYSNPEKHIKSNLLNSKGEPVELILFLNQKKNFIISGNFIDYKTTYQYVLALPIKDIDKIRGINKYNFNKLGLTNSQQIKNAKKIAIEDEGLKIRDWPQTPEEWEKFDRDWEHMLTKWKNDNNNNLDWMSI